MAEAQLLVVRPAPHHHRGFSTPQIMFLTITALLPAATWGIFLFGWTAAALPLLVAVGTSVAAEGIVNLKMQKLTLHDGSAALSGLLLGMTLPPATPIHIVVIAALFANLVVKWSFGGLGCNWMNPALAARALVFYSFPENLLKDWLAPQIINLPDTFTAATPLLVARTGFGQTATGPMQLMDGLSYKELFLGFSSGSIGENSTMLLLAGGLMLILLRIIDFRVALAFLLSVAIGAVAIGGLPYNQGWFRGDGLFHLSSGGVALAAFFMITDPASSPIHRRGQIIAAGIAGLLTVIFRCYGSYPEGVMLAVLLMNCFNPLIDLLVKDRIYGQPKRNIRQIITSRKAKKGTGKLNEES